MNNLEALQALYDDKRVRKKKWKEDAFIYLNGGDILNNKYEYDTFSFTSEDEWEIYEEKYAITDDMLISIDNKISRILCDLSEKLEKDMSLFWTARCKIMEVITDEIGKWLIKKCQ